MPRIATRRCNSRATRRRRTNTRARDAHRRHLLQSPCAYFFFQRCLNAPSHPRCDRRGRSRRCRRISRFPVAAATRLFAHLHVAAAAAAAAAAVAAAAIMVVVVIVVVVVVIGVVVVVFGVVAMCRLERDRRSRASVVARFFVVACDSGSRPLSPSSSCALPLRLRSTCTPSCVLQALQNVVARFKS